MKKKIEKNTCSTYDNMCHALPPPPKKRPPLLPYWQWIPQFSNRTTVIVQKIILFIYQYILTCMWTFPLSPKLLTQVMNFTIYGEGFKNVMHSVYPPLLWMWQEDFHYIVILAPDTVAMHLDRGLQEYQNHTISIFKIYTGAKKKIFQDIHVIHFHCMGIIALP